MFLIWVLSTDRVMGYSCGESIGLCCVGLLEGWSMRGFLVFLLCWVLGIVFFCAPFRAFAWGGGYAFLIASAIELTALGVFAYRAWRVL